METQKFESWCIVELFGHQRIAYLLEGWQKSAGAHLEMHVAHRVGMEIVIAREVVALSVAQGGAA